MSIIIIIIISTVSCHSSYRNCEAVLFMYQLQCRHTQESYFNVDEQVLKVS